MAKECFVVKYRTIDASPESGILRGSLIEIVPQRRGWDKRGAKEGEWVGITKIPQDLNLLNNLLTGQLTIDVENTTIEEARFSSEKDLNRIEATKYVEFSGSQWQESQYFQRPASKETYVKYLEYFLAEFTRITRHLPSERLVELFPAPWVFPTQACLFVGRDGVAIAYFSPRRPEGVEVEIDLGKILDQLLLPHPSHKKFLSNGPNRLTTLICDDSHFLRIVADDTFVQKAELGNPDFLISERRFHGFWENLRVLRGYGDGTFVDSKFQLVEFFGDIEEANFTKEKAEERARIYASQWATQKISNGQEKVPAKLKEILVEFRSLCDSGINNEPVIEKFMDSHPWILERGFGYKKYHSQVTIDEQLLSRSENDIRPDKFLERHDGYCDILDLKRPDTNILVRKLNRTHASSKLTEAEAQVDNYVSYVKEPKVREYLQGIGIKVLAPKGVLLMGRRPSVGLDRWEDIKGRLCVSIYTYDDVLEELEKLVSWVDEMVSPEMLDT